jgi:hypothetical protein
MSSGCVPSTSINFHKCRPQLWVQSLALKLFQVPDLVGMVDQYPYNSAVKGQLVSQIRKIGDPVGGNWQTIEYLRAGFSRKAGTCASSWRTSVTVPSSTSPALTTSQASINVETTIALVWSMLVFNCSLTPSADYTMISSKNKRSLSYTNYFVSLDMRSEASTPFLRVLVHLCTVLRKHGSIDDHSRRSERTQWFPAKLLHQGCLRWRTCQMVRSIGVKA